MTVPLRDIHVPPAPPWWPPAPGWWIVAAVVLAACVVAIAWRLHRTRRRRRAEAMFDDAVARAPTPAAAIAAMSELLRRAARRHDAAADRLQGDAWLAWLRARLPPAQAGLLAADAPAGRWLLEGGYRAEVAPADADAVRAVARDAWLALVAPGRRR